MLSPRACAAAPPTNERPGKETPAGQSEVSRGKPLTSRRENCVTGGEAVAQLGIGRAGRGGGGEGDQGRRTAFG